MLVPRSALLRCVASSLVAFACFASPVAASPNPFVGLWVVDRAPWNGERFTSAGTVVEYNRGHAIGEFPYTVTSATTAVVDYGFLKLVYHLANGALTSYNNHGMLRFHPARAIVAPPVRHNPLL